MPILFVADKKKQPHERRKKMDKKELNRRIIQLETSMNIIKYDFEHHEDEVKEDLERMKFEIEYILNHFK